MRRIAMLSVTVLLMAVTACTSAASPETQQASPTARATATASPHASEPPDMWQLKDKYLSCYQSDTPPCPSIVVVITSTGDTRVNEPKIQKAPGIHVEVRPVRNCNGEVPGCQDYWTVTWSYAADVIPLFGNAYYRSVGGWTWGALVLPDTGKRVGHHLRYDDSRVLKLYAIPRKG